MEIVREDEEIDDLLNKVVDQIDKGGSRYPGMSFEQGIEQAIRWLTHDGYDHPYEDE